MKIKKVGFLFWLFLVVYWPLVICATIFLLKLGISTIFFLTDGLFYFNWKMALSYSIKMGVSGGIPLGIGIWFMSWMKARKEKQSPPKE
ncbi:Uncharacterised protein [Serratia quinivorans]|uniref:hypothetical protein n=1 Tax=Serratia quinivorans TaxID=137545 RepID=UPI002178F7FA|nr:hypothetical protein [Serratia quinivorans]CAI1035266.1 Uncharacterised protein [Serratia quinivorans]